MPLGWVWGEGSWDYGSPRPYEMSRETYETMCAQERAAAQMNAGTAMPDKLPPAEVTTTTDYQKAVVKVRRDGARERTYECHGANEGDRITDLVKKIYDDPATPEYVRRG